MTDTDALRFPEELTSAPMQPSSPALAPPVMPPLSPRQKAAIIVRILLAGGGNLHLANLPQSMQVDLARTLSELKGINKHVERQVVTEFLDVLDDSAGYYGHGLDGALSMLEGAISPDAIKTLTGGSYSPKRADPWPKIADFSPDKISAVLEQESAEIAAIVLSKLDGQKAAEVLSKMEGPKARRAAFTVSRISSAAPDAVRDIGLALLDQISDEPKRAFSGDPAALVGSMLLSANSATRDDILEGLKEEDQGFADRVRGEIFIFADIAERLDPVDIPKILREVEQGELLLALKYGESSGEGDAASANFILDNMSKRMAAGLREEMGDQPDVDSVAGEAAQGKVVTAICAMSESGEIQLKPAAAPETGAD